MIDIFKRIIYSILMLIMGMLLVGCNRGGLQSTVHAKGLLAASSTSNFDPNYKLEVKVIDKSAPQGAPAKSELWITYSNGLQEKLVSPHIDADATKTIIDIKTLSTSLDKTKVYFATSAWATSDAIHMVNLVTKSETYVTDGFLLQVIKDGKYKGDLQVEKSKLGGSGRYIENVVVDDNGNVITILTDSQAKALESAMQTETN